ncbi:MAG: phage/plasmid replication protein, II/X family [Peptococcaceae bacterium]|jgi:II/X family phage/plasmid replication protein|nr:phage/plasmid replication protein, II/X family [Peptococcaceae bacterium]
MIDTIGLESPEIGFDSASKIESALKKYYGVDLKTGEVMYQFISGQLVGSYDSSVSVRVSYERLIPQYELKPEGRFYNELTGKTEFLPTKTIVKMVKCKCEPYLYVECSIHKLLLGHNVFGGTDNIKFCVEFVVKLLKQSFDVDLPVPSSWLIRRIDPAMVFNLGRFESVSEYLRGLKHCYFPRKKVIAYKFESIYVPGRVTTLKLYHKGPEFYKHDRKRLLKTMKPSKVDLLQRIANKLLRVELEIKAQRLRLDFEGELPTYEKITVAYLQKTLDKEVFKLLREKQEPDRIEVYRTTESVLNRINASQMSNRKKRSLFSFWVNLATLGEEVVKESISKTVFYRDRKALIALNISWHQSDIVINEQFSGVPEGFVPVTTDKRCMSYTNYKLRLAS